MMSVHLIPRVSSLAATLMTLVTFLLAIAWASSNLMETSREHLG